MSTERQREVHAFKSEARQLLDLMINSLYSSKDVFLRELISNASDALDKRRFEALTDPSLAHPEGRQEIRIHADADARVLVIEDDGLGMSREEIIENLGTIAHSGSKEFMAKIKAAKTDEQVRALIGHFGVGFYSAFMAAEEVVVTTRRAGAAEAFAFVSTGDGEYTVEAAERDTAGTTIRLKLRPTDEENNLEDFTSEWVLRTTIKKYSDFIQYPIMLQVEEKPQAPARDDEEEAAEEAPQAPTYTWTQVNTMKAIWTRPQAEVEQREYDEFYKHITHDWLEPLETISLKAEGTLEYHALLFIPSRAPFDLYYRDARYGIRLHAQHVMVMEECQDLLPDYLRFVKGVVDSADLNLNVSREILQKDRRIGSIRKRLTKKVLDALDKIAADGGEKADKLWENFGRLLKEGAVSDHDNRERLLELLRFASTTTAKEEARRNDADAGQDDGADDPEETPKAPRVRSLADYVADMKEGQDAIYVISGESQDAVARSPHMEAFAAKGYEVIFLTDPYDEILFSSVNTYKEKPIRFVGKGEVELGSEEERQAQRSKLDSQQGDYAELLSAVKSHLETYVSEVRLSARLTSSPVCLVGEEGDYSPHFHRLLQKMGQSAMPDRKRIMEVNPDHPLLAKLQARFNADAADPKIKLFAELLHGQALLAEGSPLPDPIEYTQAVTAIMLDVV